MRGGRLENAKVPQQWKPLAAIRILEIRDGNGHGYDDKEMGDCLDKIGDNMTRRERARYLKKWVICVDVDDNKKYSLKSRHKSSFDRYLEKAGIVNIKEGIAKFKPIFSTIF